MPRLPFRLLLPLALAAALAACGEEPELAAPPADSVAATDATPKAPPPPKLAEVRTPYERALRALTSGGSFRFESQATLANGSQQYATGASSAQDYAFGVRTLPKPTEHDGNWVLHAGRYFREGPGGYDVHSLSPPSLTLLAEALISLPQDEEMLGAGEAGADCTLRRVDLNRLPTLHGRFRTLEACVQEADAKLLRIAGEWQSGEKLSAELSAHGATVQIPKIAAPDWSQEYPRR